MIKASNQNVRPGSKINFTTGAVLLVAILTMMTGCATKMSLEEAKKVSLSRDQTSVARPPRRITDILAVLDQPGQFNTDITREWKAQASALPPGKAIDKDLAGFYLKKRSAESALGYRNQALEDLRRALMYSQRTGEDDPELLFWLGTAEKSAGNFQKAVDLLQKSLSLRGRARDYYHLIDAFIMMGDIGTAKKLSRQRIVVAPISRIGQTRHNQEEASIDRMMSAVLEAQGRYAESEQYLRHMIPLLYSRSVLELAS